MGRAGLRPEAELSVIVPVFNERATAGEVVRRILSLSEVREVVVVDDGSTDGTGDELRRLAGGAVRLLSHPRNRGKGRAIRTALPHVTGRLVIIQDADLEYDPEDIPRLVAAMEDGLGAVYGSRRAAPAAAASSRLHRFARALLSWIANRLYGLAISDEATGYKLFRTEVLRSLELTCSRFEFCPEVTAKLAKRGLAIREVPVSYRPRDVAAGKKIRCADGLAALFTLIKYRFVD